MISSKEVEQKIKEVKPFLQKEFLVDQIGYFGSFARGDYSEDSDVDIIVTCRRGIGWKFFDLKDYLESVLGRKVDLVTEKLSKKTVEGKYLKSSEISMKKENRSFREYLEDMTESIEKILKYIENVEGIDDF